jgi:hypothetical protein
VKINEYPELEISLLRPRVPICNHSGDQALPWYSNLEVVFLIGESVFQDFLM